MKLHLDPLLCFSRSKKCIYLTDRNSGEILFSFPAHNQTERPEGNPLIQGTWGHAPFGFLTLSPPDFISEEFRKEFYISHFGSTNINKGESYVMEWGEYEFEQMGRVRFALGSPDAPEGFGDRAVWDREILIHGGGYFDKLTKGCIRMENSDIERLAFFAIHYYRIGYPLTLLFNDV
ncbi:MAG: L,D-transpeptidase [Firmicutes bacterium]|nr:L,D-transpeptidase [Bacillota bacterium]